MSYDLIASFLQQEINSHQFHLHHFADMQNLLKAAEENRLDVIIINSCCLYDGSFRETEIRKVLRTLCGNKNIITIFFAHNMRSVLLKKMLDAGIDIMISLQDTPQELVTALRNVMIFSSGETYISRSVREHLTEEYTDLTPKEWEVINLIQEGYSLSEIASKKCRAMSTISTQKRNAMNKLHLKNETELLRFLHQNAFF
ncbi:response regulator transcription factor [Pantoea anthophila]|uniref:response regulator transcription factor n=1 Tax=Pantoea anthophila TaxID=470931 RepID=UPI002DB70CCA|nr:response regulator transcription factor [Pantoea anthophila]MEB7540287.1 response regulator transcription factor [Pantoea anthophila]